jgi:tetratricopeptide (TPR) repeat protein
MPAALLALLALGLQAGPQPSDGSCDLAHSSSLLVSARSALQGHRYDQAAQQLREAFTACPQQHAILLELSDAHTRRRDFAQAIRAAQEFLHLEPNSVSGTLVLGNAYFMTGRFAEARRQAERVMELEPGQPTALKLKGNIEYVTGDSLHAKDTFMGLLDKHPDDAEGAYMLGRIYYQEGQVDYAMGQFQRALKLDPQSYKAYDNLGLCYEARGETDMAIRNFLTAIKLVDKEHPDYDWVYANLAHLLLDTGDAKQAFAAASKAADRNPNSARNFYIGGKALCKLGKMDLCVNWLQRSASLDPNFPDPLYLLAKAYSQLDQQEKAKETFEKFRQAKAKELNGRK